MTPPLTKSAKRVIDEVYYDFTQGSKSTVARRAVQKYKSAKLAQTAAEDQVKKIEEQLKAARDQVKSADKREEEVCNEVRNLAEEFKRSIEQVEKIEVPQDIKDIKNQDLHKKAAVIELIRYQLALLFNA